MKLNPDHVGTVLKPYQTKVTWRQTTNYAAAVNDNNPHYFDDTAKKGLVSSSKEQLHWPWRSGTS